jgi:hypothetical protein
MGVYFEPPRRQAKRAWAVMRVIAEGGYRFRTEGGKAYIERYFLVNGRPGVEEVRRRVEAHKGAMKEYREKTRLAAYKEEKKRRRP